MLSIRLFQRSKSKCVWKIMKFYKTFINTFKSIRFSCVHFKFNVLNPWIQGQVQTIQVLLGAISLFINFIQSLIIHSNSKVLHENRVHIDFTYYKAGFIPNFHSQFQVQILFQIQLFKAIFKNQLIILQRNLQSLQDCKVTFECILEKWHLE